MKPTQVSKVHHLAECPKLRSKERIAAACYEHTSFNPSDFKDNPDLVVLEMGKEIFFNTEDLEWQTRSFSLCSKTVKQYTEQCDGVEVGTRVVTGIRKALDVAFCALKGRPRFMGLRGHHRHAAAENKKYKYIICKIWRDFHNWSSEKKLHFLNIDNAHDNNGLRQKDVCIKACFAQLLGSKDFMTVERDKLKSIQSLIDRTSDEAKIKEYAKQQKKLELDIRTRLVTLGKGWGASNSENKLKRLATQSYGSWSSDDVTKIYVHKDEEFSQLVNRETNNLPDDERYHSSKATATGGAVPLKALNWGFVTKSVDYKHKEGKPLSRFTFYIAIPGASSIYDLFRMREAAAKRLIKYCIGPDVVELDFRFLGQVRTPNSSYIEDPKKAYSLDYVSKNLKRLKNNK